MGAPTPHQHEPPEKESDVFMLDHTLRVYKDDLLRPLAVHFYGVSPNLITMAALLVGLLAACAAAFQWQWAALGLWLANRFLDGLDGMVARAHARQSDFGGYLDIVSDFVVYAAIPICLYWCNQSPTNALALALLLASFYVNAASWMYLSAILEKRALGARMRGELTTVAMPATVIGGAETILFYCLFLLWPGALSWLFTLMALLVLVGVGVRLHWARRHLGAKDVE
jgi:phosphatidylglycerophosphate synthase